MARRSPSVIDAQLAISSMVRPQPTQSPISESSRQTLTQGVSKRVPVLSSGLCKHSFRRAPETSLLAVDRSRQAVCAGNYNP